MVDRDAAAQAIADFLRALGHEVSGDLEGTPERVADAWADDLLEGESMDAAMLLREGSMPTEAREPGVVVLRDVAVTTTCPHHLLPAIGTATVAYMPGPMLAGIGTIAHVVDALARRLTLQERIGEQVVEHLLEQLGARGALCKLTLTHACLVARGERKSGALVETFAVGGSFAVGGLDRDLALALLSGRV